ncbi:MAG: hypothetical protein AB2421_05685 [Thermotaleaceae bacterium]
MKKFTREMMKIFFETSNAAFTEDFRILAINKEVSEAYRTYHKEIENLITVYNEGEDDTDHGAKSLYNQLEDKFWKFILTNLHRPEDVTRAYNGYLNIHGYTEWEQQLASLGISFDLNQIFHRIDRFALIKELYGVKNNFETEQLIKRFRGIAQEFFQSIDTFEALEESRIDELHDSLFETFSDYFHQEIGLLSVLRERFPQEEGLVIMEEIFHENIIFSYENFFFFIEHYGIPQGFAKFEAQFNHKELLGLLEEAALKDIQADLEKMIQEREAGVLEQDIVEQLVEASNRFYSKVFNRYNLDVLAHEIREQMVEILTDYIWEQYPHGDVNSVVNGFASFTYLYADARVNQCNISELCREELDMHTIFGSLYKEGMKEEEVLRFERYLTSVYEQNFDQALAIFPEYEYPHYYKVLYLMYLTDSHKNLEEIADQEWLNVQYHLDHLRYLKDILSGKKLCLGLPALNGNLVEFTQRMIGMDFANPMARIYPTFMSMVDLLVSNIQQRQNIAALNEALKESVASQKDIVSNYSHAWKHVVFPNTVKDIAIRLIKDFEEDSNDMEMLRQKHREYGAKLMKAYKAESIMKRQGELLVLKHSSDSTSLQNAIRSDVLRPGTGEEGIGILDVVHESLETLLFGIIMREEDASNIDRILREQLFDGRDMVSLREEFTQLFILSDQKHSILEWAMDKIYPIQIQELDENWRSIGLVKGGNAAVFFVDIFTELFYNAFKYGKKSKKEGFIHLKFTTLQREDRDFLEIRVENSKEENAVQFWSTGSGISSLNRLLCKINAVEGISREGKYADGRRESENFVTTVQLIKSMFVKRSRKRS